VGLDSLGHPIIHYTLTINNPIPVSGNVLLGANNLNQSNVSQLTDTLYPASITTVVGTIDDTLPVGALLMLQVYYTFGGNLDTMCTTPFNVLNNTPCNSLCDSMIANIVLQECGIDSGIPAMLLYAYVNYHGSPGSTASFTSSDPGQTVIDANPFAILNGSYIPIKVFDPTGFTGPYVITITISDPLHGTCTRSITVDTVCDNQIDSCTFPYTLTLDSCVGFDSLGHPIIHFTFTATNPFTDVTHLLFWVPIDGGGDVNNGQLITLQSDIANPYPTPTVFQGTFIDTAALSDSIYFIVGFIDSATGLACGEDIAMPNNIPCSLCPTVELLAQECELNADDSVIQTDFYYYINWQGANYTPLTVTSSCPGNVGVQIAYPTDPTPVLMNPGSYFVVSMTDTFPYADSCTIKFSVPGCQAGSPVSTLDTCINLNAAFGCDTVVPVFVLDSCIGIDSVTGYPIFSYTMTIINSSYGFNSFIIFPDSPTVKFTIDSTDMQPGLNTYQGTFEQAGGTSPIYLSYTIADFNSKANEVCLEGYTDTLTSPCSGGEHGVVRMFLYPNPTGTTSNLVYEIEGEDKPDMILVTDMVGNKVMEFDNLQQKGALVLNSGPLAPSIYFVSMYQHHKPIITARWSVMR
jgi:hypothetical protein